MTISVADAEGKLDELVWRAEAGEDVVLTLDGEPVLRLVPGGKFDSDLPSQ
jgi:prevent-host-death family protein